MILKNADSLQIVLQLLEILKRKISDQRFAALRAGLCRFAVKG